MYARKFSNLMPFGCWWFLNNPSIVEEITRERIELLGTSFIPQHSDARVLEQVLYKWRNTRATMSQVLGNSYRLLARDGRGGDATKYPARCEPPVPWKLRTIRQPGLKNEDGARASRP